MHARTPLFALLGIFFLLVVPMSVQAQDSNDTSELAKQLSALQTMNRTVGPMIANAIRAKTGRWPLVFAFQPWCRINQMKNPIDRKAQAISNQPHPKTGIPANSGGR